MYLVTFSKQADKDKKLLKSAGLDKKAKELLNVISGNPFQNPPPYEKSVGNIRSRITQLTSRMHPAMYTRELFSSKECGRTTNKYEKEAVFCYSLFSGR